MLSEVYTPLDHPMSQKCFENTTLQIALQAILKMKNDTHYFLPAACGHTFSVGKLLETSATS